MVANVWSIEKEKYLPYNLKKDYIKQQCEAACAALGERFHFHMEMMNQEKGDTTKSVLNDLAEAH